MMTDDKTRANAQDKTAKDEKDAQADTPTADGASKPARRIPQWAFIAAGAFFLTGAAAAAFFGGFQKTAPAAPAQCQDAAQKVQALKPFVKGDMQTFVPSEKPQSFADVVFVGPDGQKTRIGAFAGKTILLNVWATWCAPCREEMPALNQLQAMQGAAGFTVIALNADTFRPERAKGYLAQFGADSLAFYSDPTGEAVSALKQKGKALLGFPATLLINKDGCDLGSMNGGAKWSSQDAVALLQAAQ